MSVCIVDPLQAVDVDNGHAVGLFKLMHEIIKIQPRIGFRKRVAVKVDQHGAAALALVVPAKIEVDLRRQFEHAPAIPHGKIL